MKTWETPRLIVLTRNRPEEAVLDSCKDIYVESAGPNNVLNRCHFEPQGIACVNYCDQLSSS